jgi:hypothetical protein
MGAIFPDVKGAGRNPEHWLTSSDKVRIRGVITPLPHMPLLCTLFSPVFYQANFNAISQTNLALRMTNNQLITKNPSLQCHTVLATYSTDK